MRIEDEMAYDVASESNVHGSTWDGFCQSGMIPRMTSKDRPMSSSGYPPSFPPRQVCHTLFDFLSGFMA